MTRREWIALISAAPLLKAAPGPGDAAPAAPVAIAKCASYDEDVTARLATMFDQLGGLDRIVRGKTVTIKLNMTGSPGLRVDGRPPGVTHYVHPKLVGATAHLMGQAGARRIRFVESAWATSGPLEEYLLDSGWNVRQLLAAAPGVEFENTNALGKGKQYARFKVPGGGYLFPAYDLNHAYEDTDVFVSMAKLKNHATCGVTLSMKNCFGMLARVHLWRRRGRGRAQRKPHIRPRQDHARGPAAAFQIGARGAGPVFQPRAGISRAAHCRRSGEVAARRSGDYRWHRVHRGRRRAVDQGHPPGAAGSAAGGA
jgi:hypothetical protein